MMLSILAIYKYRPTVFDGVVFPSGLDRENVINQILQDNAELSLVYTDPDFLTQAITTWGVTMAPLWDRFYKAAQAEYNPIENYDRYEESERVNSGDIQHSGTDTATGTDSSTSTNSGTDTETTKIAAFDSTTLPVHDEKTIQHGLSNNTTGSNSGSYTYGHKEDHNETEGTNSHIHGNIGVTTSQQMLEQELAILGKLNLYQKISDDFRARFCVEVW